LHNTWVVREGAEVYSKRPKARGGRGGLGGGLQKVGSVANQKREGAQVGRNRKIPCGKDDWVRQINVKPGNVVTHQREGSLLTLKK